jgi:TctA family transporter
VLYLIPLLVILFSLFSTLLVEGLRSEPLSILGGYTGLFFALIVLQRSLREQLPTGSTLYLEYAFFYTYITIILLIIHTILMYYYKNWESYQKKSLYLMRIMFWPFQLIAWLITTLIVFY